MFALMDMSEVVLKLGMLVEVVDDVGEREHQGILDAFPAAHPLLELGVVIEAAIKVHCTQQ